VGRVEDSLFGGSPMPYRWRYLVTLPTLALTAFIMVGAWFVPDVEPTGHLGISLIGATMLGFTLYANRVLRRRAAAED